MPDLALGSCKVNEREEGAGQEGWAEPAAQRAQACLEPAQSQGLVCMQAVPQNDQSSAQLPQI